MSELIDRQPISWRLWARRITMVLLPLSLLGGWWLDHARQTEALEPLRKQLEDRQAKLRSMQTQLARYMAFDGFDSVAEVIEIMEASLPDFAYEKQCRAIRGADDEVYHPAVSQVITLLDHPKPEMRQRAWQMLEHTRQDDRFAPHQEAYMEGVAAMLHRPSVPAFSEILAWLRKNHFRSEAFLSGVRSRMMDDDDIYAAHSAYTLAKLDPEADIAPRLMEMVERRHSQWPYILHELPKYMPADDAEAFVAKVNQEVREAADNRELKRQMVGGGN